MCCISSGFNALLSSDIKLDKEQSATHFRTVLKPRVSAAVMMHSIGLEFKSQFVGCVVLPVLPYLRLHH